MPACLAIRRSVMSMCGILALTVASQLFINVYPVFVNALAAADRATPSQLGRLATVEYLSMAVVSMAAVRLVPVFRFRQVGVFASVVQIGAVIGTTYLSGNKLLIVRMLFAAVCGIQVYMGPFKQTTGKSHRIFNSSI